MSGRAEETHGFLKTQGLPVDVRELPAGLLKAQMCVRLDVEA